MLAMATPWAWSSWGQGLLVVAGRCCFQVRDNEPPKHPPGRAIKALSFFPANPIATVSIPKVSVGFWWWSGRQSKHLFFRCGFCHLCMG